MMALLEVTTVEQSRKLLELGLDPKSSNMYYSLDEEDQTYQILYPYRYEHLDELTIYDRLCPAWTLDALFKLIPRTHKFKNAFREYTKSGKIIWCFWCHAISEYTFEGDTDFDCIYNMVVWLLENKYINNGNT